MRNYLDDEAEDDRLLLDSIFEAVVAASDGNTQAAKWAVGQMTRERRFVERLATVRTLAKVRPADYWAHG